MNNNLSIWGDVGTSVREDCPIGPQGAQVPDYLFDGMNINNNNIDSGDDGNNSHHTWKMTHPSSTSG